MAKRTTKYACMASYKNRLSFLWPQLDTPTMLLRFVYRTADISSLSRSLDCAEWVHQNE